MNPKTIKASFEQVKPIAVEAVTYFYELMFSKYPEVKPMFENVDMEAQKKALIGSLVFAVDNLENPNKLVPVLKKMGAKHLDYGVEEFHYPIVGECLLATFKHFFKEGWTADLAKNWAEVYGVVSATMIEGALEKQDIMTTAKSKAHQLLVAAIAQVLKDEAFTKLAQAEARKILEKALDKEVERALSTSDKSKRAA